MKVELRKWSLADKEELKELCNAVDRTYLSDRLPNPYTDDDANWWLNRVTKSEGIDGTFRAMVVDGKIVGSISIERNADIYRLDGELGYMLLKDYWNRGLMSQAVEQVCEIAIKELGLNRITAKVFHPNLASQRILLKNGFTQESVMRNAVIKDGVFYDILLYSLLKKIPI
ncbi:MAG: GNAT family N-acetyltransferase [Bacteroidaceae bacterium]|nr:GNAT family N-acetyltransferase [Bacteroidaceae bacterium]